MPSRFWVPTAERPAALERHAEVSVLPRRTHKQVSQVVSWGHPLYGGDSSFVNDELTDVESRILHAVKLRCIGAPNKHLLVREGKHNRLRDCLGGSCPSMPLTIYLVLIRK